MRDAPHQPPPDAGFVEVADRVWVSRRSWYDVNLTLVGGERGLVLIDTHAGEAAGRAVLDDVAALGGPYADAPLVAVVNTHAHHDHVLGNAAVRAAYPDVPLVAHDETAAALAAWQPDPDELPGDDPRREEVLAARVVVPDTTFSSVHVIDLGDRSVELVHPGPGHTGGDLVARVEDADVLVVGDLVEESDVPAYGADCHPLAWPTALDLVIGLTGQGTVVVPGHGALVDRDFVEAQRDAIGVVAETVRDLAGRGVPLDEAAGQASWPYPAERLEHALARGYAALPRARRQLPLA